MLHLDFTTLASYTIIMAPFISPSKGKLELEDVLRDITAYMNEDTRFAYRLIIGSDSQANTPLKPKIQVEKRQNIDFVNAIVIHRVGRGGRYFWRRLHREYQNPLSLKARIFTEANLSIELALEVLTLLQQQLARVQVDSQPNIEVHIDVGQNGPTREMVKELVGLVRSSGFEAYIKPQAYAASTVADKYA
jgi:uncharacterized protein